MIEIGLLLKSTVTTSVTNAPAETTGPTRLPRSQAGWPAQLEGLLSPNFSLPSVNNRGGAGYSSHVMSCSLIGDDLEQWQFSCITEGNRPGLEAISDHVRTTRHPALAVAVGFEDRKNTGRRRAVFVSIAPARSLIVAAFAGSRVEDYRAFKA